MPNQAVRKPGVGEIAYSNYLAQSGYRDIGGHWIMNESDGSTFQDTSVFGNDGTLTNTGWASGQFGPCLDFNGTSSFGEITGFNTLSNETFTILLWIRPSLIDVDTHVFLNMEESGSGDERVRFYYFATGGRLDFEDDFGIDINSGDMLVVDKWYHAAVTYDFPGSSVKLYLDARQVAEAISGFTQAGSAINQITLGKKTSFTELFYPGLLDDLRIYNRVLTPNEILIIYNNGFLEFAPATQRRRTLVAAAGGPTVPDQTYAPTMQLMESGGYIGATIR